MQDNSDLIIRDCCEAEVAQFGKPDTICITVDVLREIVQRHSPGPCLQQIQEPAAASAAVALADEHAAFEIWWGTPHIWSQGHKEAQWNAWQARAALAATPAADAPMVDMTPPATRRDRWMYEQGRQAERDPRTANSIGQDAARYRWLRNESWAGYNIAKRKPEVALVALTRDGAGNIKLILAEDGMDTAIDAAIAAAKGGA